VSDGRVCDVESIGTPSLLKIIRSDSSLVRMFPTFILNCEENVVWFKLVVVEVKGRCGELNS
jgi:hypothetical protein